MMLRIPHALAGLVIVCAWTASAPAATPETEAGTRRAVIICGAGGVEEYQKKFIDWARRLREALASRLDFDSENIVWLCESPPQGEAREVNLESIEQTLDSLKEQTTENDELHVFLIGHGSYLRQESKFHIPGDDLTAEKLAEWLNGATARELIVVNAASASAGFINALSGPGRIVCTATKSVEEDNATEFMEFFLQGLEDGSADRDRDGRITLLEACDQAAAVGEAWYRNEGLMATEHALLDDNGDALGSRLPVSGADMAKNESMDGSRASLVYLRDFSFPPSVPRELIDRYRAALASVDALKLEKGKLEEEAYYARLEELLLTAARANREIHQLVDKAAAAGDS